MSYFIKIEDSPDLRRKILESSKASLHTLKGYHDLLRIRGEKLTLMNDLRRELKELTMLLNRAEALMPQFTERELMELQPKPAPQVLPKLPQAGPEGKWVKKAGKKVFIAAPKRQVVMQVPVPHPDLVPAAQERPKPRPLTELEKLEQALSQIDKRLGNL
jgi:hypothetical protein